MRRAAWTRVGLAVGIGAAAVAAAHVVRAREAQSMDPSKPRAHSGESCALPVSDAELRKRLTPEQYRVVRENGTEAPFANPYWNNRRPGLYTDVVSGEPLFASSDKFDSSTGWPSFTKPVHPGAVVEVSDASHGMDRTEVRSKNANSHLGHVFTDGPGPSGLRYCINSASLRFIPLEELEQRGYGAYRALFGPSNSEAR